MKNSVLWDVAPCGSTRRHIPEDGILRLLTDFIFRLPYILIYKIIYTNICKNNDAP
jgi:hypothetical protein